MSRSEGLWVIFVLTFINVLVLHILNVTSIGRIIGGVIDTYGDPGSGIIWGVILSIISMHGLIQLGIISLAIWKYRVIGGIVSITGFVGWILIFNVVGGANPMISIMGIILIVISAGIARSSK